MTTILPIHSKDGHVYWVEEGDTLYIERLKQGQYQRTNWHFAQLLVDDWTCAIDVGSNNACNAIHYAKRFAHVECFEPTPLAQLLWTNTVRDNQVQNVQLHKFAVGEAAKQVEMLAHVKNGGHNHIRATANNTIKEIYRVDVRTLDSYMFQNVGFVKVDVEGYEKFVLEGAQLLIQQSRPTIQLEIVSHQCRKFGYKPEQMIEEIRSWDYTVVSKNRGNLYGEFTSTPKQVLYNGQHYRREMDLWFQPNERVRPEMTHTTTFDQLFEQE